MARFEVRGWYDGEDDCEPPEPGKRWLTVTLDDEEFCVVVQRMTEQPDGTLGYDEQGTLERSKRADLIRDALHNYWKET
jgi:hypothetical protein